MLTKKKTILSIFLLFSIVILSQLVLAQPGNVSGSYNQTVETWVNVTNAPPYIRSVTLPSEIDLTPGSTTEINCTVKVEEFNGWQTIKLVNATFWDNSNVTQADNDLNVSHYFNDNCTRSTADEGPYNRTYYCTFDIQYYAFNSTEWICNATALDNSTHNFTDTEINTTTVNPLFAVDVTPQINFGEAAVGEEVTNKTANATNFGNQAINLTVQGYARTIGDGLAMNCSVNGEIEIQHLKFSSTAGGSRTPMDGTLQNLTGVTINRIDQVVVQPGAITSTFWDLLIHPLLEPFGVCTGNVIFTAWNA